jgi:hypothetical protein
LKAANPLRFIAALHNVADIARGFLVAQPHT